MLLVGASHARQVKGDDPDKKGYTGPPGWWLGVRLTTSPCKKILLRNLNRRPRPTQGCRADDDDDDDDPKIQIFMPPTIVNEMSSPSSQSTPRILYNYLIS